MLKSYDVFIVNLFCNFKQSKIYLLILNKELHKFSLSGLPGVFFGIISILFICLIKYSVNSYTTGDSPLSFLPINYFEYLIIFVCFAFVATSYLVIIRRNKSPKITWSKKSKTIRKLILLTILIGALLSYLLLSYGELKLIISTTLIIYSLFLIFVNKYSKGNTFVLGICFFILGIITSYFNQYQYILFGLSFGVLHILYGIYYRKLRNM